MSIPNAFFIEGNPNRVQFELTHLDPVVIGTIQTPTLQSSCAIAIGELAGLYNQGECAIAIGESAGRTNQGMMGIAIGAGAGTQDQSELAVALGVDAGSTGQSIHAIAIGTEAGFANQGTHAIAIGHYAGQTNQPQNSIVLNASGSVISTVTRSGALYIDPIFAATSSNVLYYNATSKEVSYGAAPSGGGGGGGEGQMLSYLNANQYFRSSVTTTQTVTLQSVLPPTFPTEPTTPTFSGTVYSVTTEAQFVTALTNATNGDIIEIPAATTITFTTSKTINKSLEIRGVNATTSAILATFALSGSLIDILGVKADNVTPNHNVYIHDLTITVTNNTSDCSVIGASTVGTNNLTGSTGLRFQNLNLTTTEVCITISAAEWVIKNCTMSYTPPGGANDNQRHIAIYNIGTKGWIEGCAFNATTEYPVPRTTCIFLGSIPYGPTNSTGFAGDLVIKNNVQSFGILRQFYLQEVFRSNGLTSAPMPLNALSLWVEGNRFTPYSSSSFVFYEGAGTLSPLNFFNILYFINNQTGQGFGSQKGMIGVDGVGAVRTPGTPAQFIVSGNVIGDIFPISFNNTYQTTTIIPNVLGVNSTFFSVPSITLQVPTISSFPFSSREYLSLGYIPKNTWNFSIYASSTDNSGNTTFSISLGHTDSLGSNYVNLYTSSNFIVNSNVPSAFTHSFSTNYTLLSSITRRLRLTLNITQTAATSLSFVFDNNAYLSGVQNVAPKIPFAGSVAIASLAANSITSQTILFSNPLNPLISLPAVSALVNTTGSTNGSYVLPSFSNLSIVGFSLDTRNLHTSAAATAFNATWSATQL
jgi:hypothetical protein